MKGIKVKLKDAEKIKKELINLKALNSDYYVLKEKDSIIFPVTKELKNYKLIEKEFNKIKKIKTLKQILKEKIKDSNKIKKSQEIIGDICIIETDSLIDEKEIASLILKSNPKIKTILLKEGFHSGEFRTQNMKYVAGEKKKETIYIENNVKIKLNVEEVYFSSRLCTERKRIMQQVKPGENILVMFSGCAPYPCVLSKNTQANSITGIEINPTGHKYGLENIKLNKIENVKLYCGDVRKIIPKLKQKFDRIIMPLPKTAEEFLDLALSVIKKKGIIHIYDFLNEKNIPDEAIKKIYKYCNNCKILKTVKCGQHAPHVFRICTDFKVL